MGFVHLFSVLLAAQAYLPLAACDADQKPLENDDLEPTSTTEGIFPTVCEDDVPPVTTYNYCSSFLSGFTTTPGYTVSSITSCTGSGYVRSATRLSPQETQWQQIRSASAVKAMATYFPQAWGGPNAQYNVAALLTSPPRIGLAFSGGGYRAMFGGAGVLQAYDKPENGGMPGLAGIVDSALYVSALSGGGWLVGSWALNNYPNISTLNNLWNLSIGELGGLDWQWADLKTCHAVQCEIQQKFNSGAPVSFADAWHRLIARNILNGVPGNATWSGLLRSSKLVSGNAPLPIILGVGRTNLATYEYNGTVFEMTPFEFGNWDPTDIGSFVDMRVLGTPLWAGTPWDGTCTMGFDNAAFILGTSSLAITPALVDVGEGIAGSDSVIPNPFCRSCRNPQCQCDTGTLYVNDGGDDGQNVPLLPLLQPYRAMDAIVAVDMSADTGDGTGSCCGYSWPQAYSLNWTKWYANTLSGRAQGISVPRNLPTPDQVANNLALVYTPTFFGCNSSDGTIPNIKPPLIVYLPNAPYTAWPNATTLSTGTWEWGSVADDLIENSRALASTGIPGLPQSWPTCLACALADRSRERLGMSRTPACTACFAAYCAETKASVPGLTEPSSGYYSPPPIKNNIGNPPKPATDTYCYVWPSCSSWIGRLTCSWRCSNTSPSACSCSDNDRPKHPKSKKVSKNSVRDEL